MKNNTNFASELQNIRKKYSKSLRRQMRKMEIGIFPINYFELRERIEENYQKYYANQLH